MRRLTACLPLLIIFCFEFAQATSLDAIRELRLRGELSAALSAAVSELHTADTQTAFDLHLEMARIHDRIGLHTDSRPVAAALQEVNLAAGIADELDSSAQAKADLAYAEFYYRAEMSDRAFEMASMHANKAHAAFESLNDHHSQADAVHRLGLIKLQQDELQMAHELFVESLRLDRMAGERALLRADYERHVGFVFALQGDVASALPYFERSLEFRINAGAIDASMFAAISVASALVELGRSDEAQPHISYALRIAEDIDSETGRSRAESILAKIP